MITLVYGDDIFRSRQHIDQLTQQTDQTSPWQKIDGRNLKPSDLTNILQPLQLFSSQTNIILINSLAGTQANADILIQNINHPPNHLNLVIWEHNTVDKRKSFYKNIKKAGIKISEFNQLKKYQLSDWIKAYCQKQQINITTDAINFLAESHPSPYQLHQEISKLKMFTDNQITRQAITQISPPTATSIIFDLTDQIGRKSNQAFDTAQNLVNQGEYPPKIIATLATHISNLIIIKELSDRKYSLVQIKNISGLHPFVIDKGHQQSRNFSLTDLKKIYQKIASADIKLKSGQTDFNLALFSIINYDLQV